MARLLSPDCPGIRRLWALSHIVIVTLMTGCNTGSLYEETRDLKNRQWRADSVFTYQFNAADSVQAVDLYFTVRNTPAYPFYNLYVKYRVMDSMFVTVDSGLAHVNLFEPKTGEPYGSGVGGIFSHIFPLATNLTLNQGSYRLELEQNMRIDSIPGIVSVGVKVAAAGQSD